MNGVTQTQPQRPKLPAGPAPVNSPPPPPPAQKPTPGHSHPSHPHPRTNQHPTAQPPPNRGQPPPNAQHSKNKKKVEPAPVDPAVMYESLKSRIAALEEEETHEEEEERGFGASFASSTLFNASAQKVDQTHALRFTAEEAQKSVKGVPDNLVHTKYVELVWPSPPSLCRGSIPVFTRNSSVRRIQTTREGPRQGETEVGQGQGCRLTINVGAYIPVPDTVLNVHSQGSAYEGESDQSKDGKPGS